ncbi:hypothetical protein HYV79_02880 [Candidatus Woesearchaeota archaeon]|nr:hypothetical protein [Candidatus Woesearchaeota archaeon]
MHKKRKKSCKSSNNALKNKYVKPLIVLTVLFLFIGSIFLFESTGNTLQDTFDNLFQQSVKRAEISPFDPDHFQTQFLKGSPEDLRNEVSGTFTPDRKGGGIFSNRVSPHYPVDGMINILFAPKSDCPRKIITTRDPVETSFSLDLAYAMTLPALTEMPLVVLPEKEEKKEAFAIGIPSFGCRISVEKIKNNFVVKTPDQQFDLPGSDQEGCIKSSAGEVAVPRGFSGKTGVINLDGPCPQGIDAVISQLGFKPIGKIKTCNPGEYCSNGKCLSRSVIRQAKPVAAPDLVTVALPPKAAEQVEQAIPALRIGLPGPAPAGEGETPGKGFYVPVCGNLQIDFGEECETGSGTCPEGFTCGSDCKCKKPVCGNSKVEAGELCDGDASCKISISDCKYDPSCLSADIKCVNNCGSCLFPECKDGQKVKWCRCVPPLAISPPIDLSNTKLCTSQKISSVCGNGIKESGEKCEADGDCPDGSVCDVGTSSNTCVCVFVREPVYYVPPPSPDLVTVAKQPLVCPDGSYKVWENGKEVCKYYYGITPEYTPTAPQTGIIIVGGPAANAPYYARVVAPLFTGMQTANNCPDKIFSEEFEENTKEECSSESEAITKNEILTSRRCGELCGGINCRYKPPAIVFDLKYEDNTCKIDIKCDCEPADEEPTTFPGAPKPPIVPIPTGEPVPPETEPIPESVVDGGGGINEGNDPNCPVEEKVKPSCEFSKQLKELSDKPIGDKSVCDSANTIEKLQLNCEEACNADSEYKKKRETCICSPKFQKTVSECKEIQSGIWQSTVSGSCSCSCRS